MRGGEVLGGYGYSAREEYALPRGELAGGASERHEAEPSEGTDDVRR
jgi:hypothetical protein